MKHISTITALTILSILTSCGTAASISELGQPDPALAGTWVNHQHTNEKNGKGEAYDRYTFFPDGTFAQYGYMKMDMTESDSPAYIEISFKGAGKYGVTNGNINFDFNPSDGTANLDKFDISADKSLTPGQAATARTVMKMILINPMMKEMRKSMKQDQIYHIDYIDASTLKMTNTKAEEPKSETYLKTDGNQ